ncbi:Unknown protein [Striga hermonthica]|uniref:GAG-pre-integrase domain-containing protein n=1 Tax=Striga hermonthica TaxID=68872 RepID=A0A9N7MHD2_STRHE|nr:Unknown protein [Striga hermonthica]
MAASTDALPVATMINMVAGIKLTSANYLPWRRQITHMAECFDLMGLLDGSVKPPSQYSPLPDNATNPNPAFLSWRTKDRKLLSVIYSSLSEEAASEVINVVSSRELWLTLEEVFSSASRHHQLREELLSLRRGDMTVDDYGRRFKGLCDQLSAIGRPVDASDQSHWFLRGLGIQFAHFADTRLAFSPIPVFRDLLNQAKQYDMLIRSMEAPPTSVAFYADRSVSSSDPSRRRFSHDGGNSQGHSGGRSNHRGRGGRQHGGGGGRHSGSGRRPYVPRCQICQGAHYANKCPQFLECRQSMSPAHLAQAFSSSCAVSSPPPDWCLDSGASTHMTNQPETLDSLKSYSGNSSVIVGNGSNLSISHIGSCRLPNGMRLNDVLVVPHLTKNLVSISKLTSDLPVDVVFSGNLFLIQHRETKEPLARGRCDGGLYYMDRWCPALAAAVRNKVSKASFELWHCRLGHASSSIISLLQKTTSRIYTTRHAQFDELCFPFSQTTSPSSVSRLDFSSFLDDMPAPPLSFENHAPPLHVAVRPTIIPDDAPDPSVDPVQPAPAQPDALMTPPSPQLGAPALIPAAPVPAVHSTGASHPMISRARHGIFKPRHPIDLTASLADIFTKSLPRPTFTFLRSKLYVDLSPTQRLRGDVRVPD